MISTGLPRLQVTGSKASSCFKVSGESSAGMPALVDQGIRRQNAETAVGENGKAIAALRGSAVAVESV